VACIGVGITPPRLDELVTDALRVLEQAGHDPAAYVLELRMEDLHQPDFRGIDAQLVPSVVFFPRAGSDRYPLRVHPRNPCSVGWLWRPESFTEWQREVLRRAGSALEEVASGSLAPGRSDVEVLESSGELALHLWSVDGAAPGLRREEIRLTIRKSDLSVVVLPGDRPGGG
jgi:hypothetical protein